MTAKEIAQKTNYSLSTVMKVLGGKAEKYNISSAAQKKIYAEAESMGYCRNDLAASVRTGVSRNIGLILEKRNNNPNMQILESILQCAAINGQGISTYMDQDVAGAFDHMRRHRIRKVISVSVTKTIREQTACFARKYGMELVFVYESSIDSFPAFNVDNYTGMKTAAEYLIKMGHQRIFFACGPLHYDYLIRRHAGFCAACKEAALSPEDMIIDFSDIKDYGKLLKDLFALPAGKRPTAILSTSDSDIMKMLPHIDKMGIKIPEDISLFGFGDMPGSEYIFQGLSSVAEPLPEVGKMAFEYIMGRKISLKRDARNDFLLDPELVLRNSVKKIVK